MKLPTLSVALPCYNESKSIHDILERFSQVIGNRPVELVLVNNGSVDNTAEALQKELRNPKYKFARTVLVKKNQGYGYGIMFGLKHCKGEIIAYSHADQQCDPLDVIRAYDELLKYDVENVLIKGHRKRRILSEFVITKGLQIITALIFWKVYDDINGQPKVFHKSFLSKLTNAPNDFKFDFYVQYMALKNKMEVKCIPVDFGQRKHGKSNWAYSIFSKTKTYLGFIVYMIKLRFGELVG
ncbi:MAG: glycosyltransferase family 2 protein [Candidatus Aenigmarchaeota archaeon]|nr:glycosyltransferase family 2 protein [Candidatus Aenigmarchaeota archaeon]